MKTDGESVQGKKKTRSDCLQLTTVLFTDLKS